MATPSGRRYVPPSDQRTHREQPPVYAEPATFAHPSAYKLEKDTAIDTVPLEARVPIPVSVVDMPRGPDRVVSFNTAGFNIAPLQEVTLSRNDNRKLLKVVNNDAVKVVYVNAKSAVGSQGYPLYPGKEFVTSSTREAYIYNPDAVATVNIAVLYELVIELDHA